MVASPFLDAVSAASTSTSRAPSASDWTRNMGLLAGSPSNLISIMGESPPTLPSSYEDQSPMPQHWAPQARQLANPHVVSASPPAGSRRPMSFQMDSQQHPAYDIRSQASSPPGARRSSMHSPLSAPRGGLNPPLPHQPQAHFFSAPELDLELDSGGGLKAGDRGFHFGFDSLPASYASHGSSGSNVAIAGYEGGLDIYSVAKRGIDPLMSLKGLRGGVYNAKILPWNGQHDPFGIFPLIAVVVHGPVFPQPSPETGVGQQTDHPGSPRLDGVRTPSSAQFNTGKTTPTIEAYQTSVEIYSLKMQTLVDVLLSAPRTPISKTATGFRRPPPSGSLQIRADEGSLVVSSGVTGECWIYRQTRVDEEPGYQFRCAGKVWTSLQPSLKTDVAPEEDRGRSHIPPRKTPQMPILALCGRYLAYCPPPASSQMPLNASIPVQVDGRAPGIHSQTSPVLPNETSDVDQPISDSMVNRVMRETTQEVIKGASWVGKQGMALWKQYWNPNQQQPAQSRSSPIGSPPYGSGFNGRPDSQFPPTYGVSGQPVTRDPGLVSIVDIQALSTSTAIHHVTTFKTPLGCSFLSFSPTGLSLFTASIKGDVQTVWDLMRIQYSKSSPLQNSQPNTGHATRVRQIAQFSRMTVARIVDVSWARPNGERIAMVTERGTVHLLDMPLSAYTWPPPRRRMAAREATPSSPEPPASMISMTSTAFSSAYGAARPLINAQRRSSITSQAPSAIMNHASYGGKVLAQNISSSLGTAGTAINHLRHTGENRVSLPLGDLASPGLSCVVWLGGRRHQALFVAGNGLVRLYPSRPRKLSDEKPRVPRGNKYTDFKLKTLPDDLISPAVRQMIEPEGDMELNQDFNGENTLVLNPRPRFDTSDPGPEASIPQAEIESSAPYQPFHTDRRVGLYEYGTKAAIPSVADVAQLLDDTTLEDRPKKGRKRHGQRDRGAVAQPWAFGQVLEATKVDTGVPVVTEEELSGSIDDHKALPESAMERVLEVGANDEQIVVTTRRKRGGNRPVDADAEDDFFEEDLEIIDFADQRV